MRNFVFALAALGAMTCAARAQNTTPAAETRQVFWVLTLAVQGNQFDQLKGLVSEIVASVQKEPGTLEYEWNVSDDKNTVDVVERYADSAAVVKHVDDFGPFAKRFFALVKPTRFVVFGAPDAAAKKAIAGLNPIYMATFDGFTR